MGTVKEALWSLSFSQAQAAANLNDLISFKEREVVGWGWVFFFFFLLSSLYCVNSITMTAIQLVKGGIFNCYEVYLFQFRPQYK